ncbi:MAG: S-methyl-5'-thioadenosine phosphorylase [Nitrospirae bacterium]|nr:S-methyl-5'-thioadenosine phosphorylase [Nitrospirota bacterium]
MAKIGVIGGSGLYEIKGLTIKGSKTVMTPFGKPSDKYFTGRIGSNEVIFLPRHGSRHSIPPHLINYRANIWGFRKLGVSRIISVSAAGCIKKGLKPGDIVILSQVIDMTRNRKSTFYDGKQGIVHIDFTEPYCPEMRKVLTRACVSSNIKLKDGGTYVAVEGPRLETAQEIKSFGKMGGDVVGMTGMPEAALAREAEICYSGLSVVANYAAGIKKKRLTVSEVMEAMREANDKIKDILKEAFRLVPGERGCGCGNALKDAKI